MKLYKLIYFILAVILAKCKNTMRIASASPTATVLSKYPSPAIPCGGFLTEKHGVINVSCVNIPLLGLPTNFVSFRRQTFRIPSMFPSRVCGLLTPRHFGDRRMPPFSFISRNNMF